MIDFEFEPQVLNQLKMYHAIAERMMRPISRDYDEREHEKPWDFFNAMWSASTNVQASPQGDSPSAKEGSSSAKEKDGGPKLRNLYTCLSTEELCWGDAGLFLSIPSSGLGGAAVGAAGTPEQKERFLKRFREGKPKWGAMAAEKSEGFVVVWATVDKKAGRAGIKPFIVEHNTPGMTVARVEKKLGIRASDTAMIVFDNCRVPTDCMLGAAEVKRDRGGSGFKEVMTTFDATRPIVAAMAIGVGRAALDFVRDFLKQQNVPIRYGLSPRRLTSVERDFMEMEVQLKVARLLTWRAAWMLDMRMRNNLEASMAKAKAGKAVTQ